MVKKKFGTKAELKNLNSFNYVRKGLEYEEKRQEEELLNGGEIDKKHVDLMNLQVKQF